MGDDAAKNGRLDQALENVLDVKGLHQVLVIDVDRHVDLRVDAADHRAAGHADDDGEDDQGRNGKKTGQQARHGEIAHRVDVEGLQGVDLLIHLHGSDLGSHRGTDAAGDQQAGHHRPQLLDHRQADNGADRVLGAVKRELDTGLEGQDHTDEESHQGGDRQSVDRHVVHLPENGRQIPGRLLEKEDRFEEQQEHLSGGLGD